MFSKSRMKMKMVGQRASTNTETTRVPHDGPSIKMHMVGSWERNAGKRRTIMGRDRNWMKLKNAKSAKVLRKSSTLERRRKFDMRTEHRLSQMRKRPKPKRLNV